MSHSIEQRWQRAKGYLSRREPAPALAQLEAMRAQDPRDVRTRLLGSQIAWRENRIRDATLEALEALRVVPEDAGLLCDTIEALLQTGEVVAARACLARPGLVRVSTPGLLLRMADFTQRLNQHGESLGFVERAIAAGATDPETAFHHGGQLYFHGRMSEAETVLDACLGEKPEHGRAAYTLSSLHAQTPASNHLAQLEAGLARVARGSLDHAALEFARYKEYEDLGRLDDAWNSLAAGNAVMRARNRFDARLQTAFQDKLAAACTAVVPQVPATALTGPQPIFVLGLTRSGTTMLDRMLSNHTQVRSAGEMVDFAAQLQWAADSRDTHDDEYFARLAKVDYPQLGQRYLTQTQWRARGKPRFIDKQPSNWQVAALIHAALPQAKILHLVRDPMDTCFSNWRAFFGDAYGYSYDMATLGAYHRAYRRTMARWHESMPGAILDVPYADLTRDPEATMRKVLDYCELAWEPGCVELTHNPTPVATLNVAQVRGPLHTRAAGLWRTYADQLGPLRAELDAEMPNPGAATETRDQ
ncbi:MAG TPA: sulfotransferase [Rhodanobacteraceae bacterium]|nr:sulfotransferase [Rhodanobacteraceae bacterium]